MTTATMHTTKGTIELDLFDDAAPTTVGNFVKLSRDGFYDGVVFHRVIEDFMIQGGDPGRSRWRTPARTRTARSSSS
jgi:cyclophilin family peptidyl-prolyl cis-trans isomerase